MPPPNMGHIQYTLPKTRFRPPYVTDQPKYAGVPQRQRSALHLRAQRNFPKPSCGTFADVPTTHITGSADRPAHHPAHYAQPPLRTCAPPCAPAPNLPCAPAPNFPAHLRLTPAHLHYATSRTAVPHHLPTCRQLHPTLSRTCPEYMRPTHPAATPMRLPPTAPPAPPPPSPARLAPAPAP
ncbi:hypothetical protein C8J57DRAFT_1530476 [Mycena rebaudengoi]|nr:hypothetical protein C8J57DRAFT_1530476 [Mycena rebaudengoi]